MTKRGCGEFCDDPVRCGGKGLPSCAKRGCADGMDKVGAVAVPTVIVIISAMPFEVLVGKPASGIPVLCVSVFVGLTAWTLLWGVCVSYVRRVWERLERYDSRSWQRLALSWCFPLLLWDFGLYLAALVAARVRANQQVLQYRSRWVEDMPIPASNGELRSRWAEDMPIPASNGKLDVDALPIAASRE